MQDIVGGGGLLFLNEILNSVDGRRYLKLQRHPEQDLSRNYEKDIVGFFLLKFSQFPYVSLMRKSESQLQKKPLFGPNTPPLSTPLN